MRTRARNQKFFFINKTTTSKHLSRSEDAETYHILSHVRARRNGQAADHTSWSSFTSCLDWNNDEGDKDKSELPQPWHDTTIVSQLTHGPMDNSRHSNQPARAAHASTDLINVDGQESARQFPVLSGIYPQYNATDPFHCTVLGVDATTSIHVVNNLTSSRISRITFLAEALAPQLVIAQSSVSWRDKARSKRLRGCVDDELLMCSSVAHGSSSLAWVSGGDNSRRSQYFVGKTLQAVRQHLADPDVVVTESLLLAVFTLAISEIWNALPYMWQPNPHCILPEHFEGCKVHLKALLALVEQMGGWSVVSPYLLDGAILIDKYVTVYNMEKPLIPLTWAPSVAPPTPPDLPVEACPSCGLGFESAVTGLELRGICREVAEFLSLATAIWKSPFLPDAPTERWLYLRRSTLTYQLLLIRGETDLEEQVRLAVLLFQQNMVSYAGGEVFSQIALCHLWQQCNRAEARIPDPDPDLQMWCLFVGATTAGRSSEKQWFIERFHGICVLAGIRPELQTIKQRLQSFLYLSPRQDSDLSNLLDVLSRDR